MLIIACTTESLGSDPVSLSRLATPIEANKLPEAEQFMLKPEVLPVTTSAIGRTTPTTSIETVPPRVTIPPTTILPTTTSFTSVKVVYQEPTTTTGSHFDPKVEQWRDLVSVYFRSTDVERILQLIYCESSGNEYAENPKKTLYGYAQGLMQHMTSLFPSRALEAHSAGYRNTGDVFNPVDNLAVGAWLLYETPQSWHHWDCAK